MKIKTITRKPGERSFSLLETVIAIGIMATIILNVVGSLGNIVYFSGYTRRMTEALYLAQRLMSQVEYRATYLPFKELNAKEDDRAFDEDDSDYRYSVEIKEWKLPIFNLISGGGANAGEEDGEKKESESNGMGALVKQFLDTDELLKTAYVEVSWPEGAKRNSVSLTMLLTNQKQIDTKLMQFEAAANDLKKATMIGAGLQQQGTPGGGAAGGGAAGGGAAGGGAGGNIGGGAGGGNPAGTIGGIPPNQ